MDELEVIEIVDESPLILAMLKGRAFKAMDENHQIGLFMLHIDYVLGKRRSGEDTRPLVKNVPVSAPDWEGYETKSKAEQGAVLWEHIDWAMLTLGEWTETL